MPGLLESRSFLPMEARADVERGDFEADQLTVVPYIEPVNDKESQDFNSTTFHYSHIVCISRAHMLRSLCAQFLIQVRDL
jgi:hypothetical protein